MVHRCHPPCHLAFILTFKDWNTVRPQRESVLMSLWGRKQKRQQLADRILLWKLFILIISREDKSNKHGRNIRSWFGILPLNLQYLWCYRKMKSHYQKSPEKIFSILICVNTWKLCFQNLLEFFISYSWLYCSCAPGHWIWGQGDEHAAAGVLLPNFISAVTMMTTSDLTQNSWATLLQDQK